MSTDDRRAPGAPRIPFDALVEVGGALGPSFEAQAVNVSEDGMQLRTAYLPEMGQPITCRFDAGPTQSVLVSGEVTWTQTADKGGEFGIRFTDMDAESIDTLRRICGVTPQLYSAQPGSKVRLHIEGLASPMRARIKDAHPTNMTVGSDLGFLQVGRQLEVEDPESGSKRPASVDRVEVVVDPTSKIPQLVVTLRYGDVQASTGTRPEVGAAPSAAATLSVASPADDLAAVEDASLMMKSALARSAARIGPALGRLTERAKTTVALLAKRRSERAADGAVQRRTTAPPPGGGLHATGRRVVRGESSAPVIEERIAEPRAGLTGRRAIVAGAVMAVAIVGAVAMKKSHHEPAQDAAVVASAAPADTSASQTAPTTQVDTATPPSTVAPTAAAPLAGVAGPGAFAASPGAAGSVGPSEEANDSAAKEAQKKHARVAPFGNGPVHHGNLLRLKMDGQIESIEGASQPTGFTVKLPSRRSLEAAAPLAARDSRIAAIKVSNDPAGAELTVTFKDGVPNYQVSARGDALIIALAPAGLLDTVAKKDEKGAKSTKRAKHDHEKKKIDAR